MTKTRKVFEIHADGVNLLCTFTAGQTINPFRIYHKWYENGGWHRKLLDSYQNLFGVICFMEHYCREHDAGMTDVWKEIAV